jgi:hypothetical protein
MNSDKLTQKLPYKFVVLFFAITMPNRRVVLPGFKSGFKIWPLGGCNRLMTSNEKKSSATAKL